MTQPSIGVAIPAIPPRVNPEFLGRAFGSVLEQTYPASRVNVVIDHEKRGAGRTRNAAWRGLGDVDYVAFLDDDDYFGPVHLERLMATACETDADLVYPWFNVVGGGDPFPMHFGREWDPADPRQTTITVLWRREALESVGGFPVGTFDGVDDGGNRAGEDFLAVCALNAAGGKIVHLPERTWYWRHHETNTSGRPEKW